MARLLIGVSGGIAAYKSLELARLATKSGHAVRVILTPTGERFVGRASFGALTGAPVLIDESGDVTGKAYGVWGPPTVYIVDRQGRLVGRAAGPRQWDSPKGRQFIEAVLAAPATP